MNSQVVRPRRLRSSPILRNLVQETSLNLDHLIQPYFLSNGSAQAKEPIPGFTGVNRWGIDALSKVMEVDLDRGVRNFLFFGSAVNKDGLGSGAYEENGVLPTALRKLKQRFSDSALLYSDVCLCPYTDHGHCGLIEGNHIANDISLDSLAKMALVHAQAGADIVAPSDMMDGRIGYIRRSLDEKGLEKVGILSYTAKYASAYYGPFREALQSSPQKNSKIPSDRTSYQMDFRNSTDALRELYLDIAEGADMVMVKPALAYLDIIQTFRQKSQVPVVAYSVSGEYEMVKVLAASGRGDERSLVVENLTAIRRAGAHAIITYFASLVAEKGWLS